MKLIFLAASGGAIGAAARFLVNQAFAGVGLTAFPWSTLTVNVVGAFLMGAVMTLVMERLGGSPEIRVFLATGILGGLTTFSAFTYEIAQLIAVDGVVSPRIIFYVAGSVLLSLAALYAGMALTRAALL